MSKCPYSGKTINGKYIPEHDDSNFVVFSEWKFLKAQKKDGKKCNILLKGVLCRTCNIYIEAERIEMPEGMEEMPTIELQTVVEFLRD